MNNSNGNPNATSPLPCLVSIPPITLSGRRRRRLSAATVEPRRPISFSKPMAWINLEGRVVNADEASSARTIGGGLSDELAFAWDLFPPIHRFLIVAVIGHAAVQSKKDREIFNLKKSVELRVCMYNFCFYSFNFFNLVFIILLLGPINLNLII